MPRRFIVPVFITAAFCIEAGCTVEEKPEPEPPKLPPALTKAIETAEKKAQDGPLVARKKSLLPVPLLLEDAKKNLDIGNYKAAIPQLEQALADEPNNREALNYYAQATQQYGQTLTRPDNSPYLLKSANALRALRVAYPKLTPEEKQYLPVVLYNEACTYAVNGESEKALKSLADAFEAGFANLETIDEDPELESLRKSPEFAQIQQKLERTVVDRLVKQTGEKQFPFDFRLTDTEGKPVSLSDFKGKVVLVDFWGTWCLPCRKAIPHLVELAKTYADRGVAVVGLTYETETGDAARKTVAAFRKENNVPYPCVIGDEATLKQVPEFGGYPTLLFLDREGKVRIKIAGYQPKTALVAAVEALLGEGKGGEEAGSPKP